MDTVGNTYQGNKIMLTINVLHKMRWVGFLLLCLVAATVAEGRVNVGDRPKLNLTTIDNNHIDSKALAGRIVILDFWATWCGPCVAEIPHMIELNKQYGPKGVQIISYSMDSNRSSVARFVKAKKMDWVNVFGGRASPLAQQFGVNSIPMVFIISPKGEVLWQGHPARIDQPLAMALKTHPPTTAGGMSRADALAILKQAKKAMLVDGDYDKALTLLGQVPDITLADSKVSVHAKNLAIKFDEPKDPETRRAPKALKAAEALRTHPKIAAKLPAIRAGLHIAKAKLEAAETALDKKNYPMAYELCMAVAQRAAQTKLATVAAKQAAELEANENIQPRLKRVKVDHLPAALLAVAIAHHKAGRTKLAQQQLEQMAAGDPQSPYTAMARQMLDDLDNPEPPKPQEQAS